MDRIELESFWFFCPDLTDVFVWREALERFQSPNVIIICGDEFGEMAAELVVAVIMIAFDGCVLDRRYALLDTGEMRLCHVFAEQLTVKEPLTVTAMRRVPYTPFGTPSRPKVLHGTHNSGVSWPAANQMGNVGGNPLGQINP